MVCAGCDCFGEEVEFGSNQTHPQGHGDYLSWRRGLLIPQMVAVLPGPVRGTRVIDNHGATMGNW